MMTKKFVEILPFATCYEIVNMTYEDAKAMVIEDNYNKFRGVREVERTFNPDTFRVTEKVLRETLYHDAFFPADRGFVENPNGRAEF